MSDERPWVEVRGIYGWSLPEVEGGTPMAELGVNAIFMSAEVVNREIADHLHAQGLRVFAEFNTLHEAQYVEEHPGAAPVEMDGEPCPPPDGWQGVCPTHPEYRRWKMARFERTLTEAGVDGMWLDYLHSHAAWEQPEPNMPDTCFCPRCLARFQRETGVELPAGDVLTQAAALLGEPRDQWVRWRCGVFTDWVREFREITDRVRPGALLGSFHNPWSDEDWDGARIEKLNIDLKAQAQYLDVFSIMPYHARFGHAQDPEWISRQTSWLGRYLGVTGDPGERHRIWPIVQLSDWGETVPVEQVHVVLDHGTRRPSTGVVVFAWHSLRKQAEKVAALGQFYHAISPADQAGNRRRARLLTRRPKPT
jgi:hypothetical protein